MPKEPETRRAPKHASDGIVHTSDLNLYRAHSLTEEEHFPKHQGISELFFL